MKIKLKRSDELITGAAKEPTAGQLDYGELAVNYSGDDPAIFLKDSNNNIIRISGVGNIADDGQVEVPESTSPPVNPEAGNLWFNSEEGRLYIYYVDSDTSQWVDASPDSWDNSIIPVLTDPLFQDGTLDERYKLKTDPNDPILGDLYIGGNIGIGADPPTERLHISENVDSDILIERTGVAPSEVRLRNYNDFAILSNNTLGIDLQTGTTPSSKVRIDADGNVGIGKTNPSEKLDVSGKTATTSLQIGGTVSAPFLSTDASGNVVSTDAPADNQQWARKNNGWAVVEATSGGGGGEGDVVNYNGAVAWGRTNSSGSLIGNLNIASVTKSATGVYDYTFVTPMPGAYSVVTGINTNNSSSAYTAHSFNETDTGFSIRTVRADSYLQTDVGHNFAIHALNALPPKGGTGADCWVDCQGSVANGPAPVNAGFNVQSVERTEAGYYKVTFTTPMPTDDYAVSGSASSGPSGARYVGVFERNTTDFTVIVKDASDAVKDTQFSVVVHATNATLPQSFTTEQIDAAINNPGASAWGSVNADGTKKGAGLNFTVAKTSTGNYEITFDTPMPNADYSVTTSAELGNFIVVHGGHTSTGFTVSTRFSNASGLTDVAFDFQVFATNALPPKSGTGADAWVATNSTGTIQSGFNIASVASGGTGIFDYTFTSPMPNAYYAVIATALSGGRCASVSNKTTTGFRVIITTASTGDVIDSTHHVVVHATNATLPTTFTSNEIQAVIDLAESGVTNPGASAWGNINGQSATLFGGLNCSVVRTPGEAAGKYDVTFDTPMPSNNYAVTGVISGGGGQRLGINNQTANGFTANVQSQGGTPIDAGVQFSVHATNATPPKGGTGADGWALTTTAGDLASGYNLAVSKSGTGIYDYTFTTPMPDTSYAVVATCINSSGRPIGVTAKTETGFQIQTKNTSFDASDTGHSVVVHATNATLPAPVTQDNLLFTDGRNIATTVQRFQGGIQLGSSGTSSTVGVQLGDTLDDYEEGTFTPRFVTGSSNANLSGAAAYARQYGSYTKIGDTVHFRLRLTLSNKGTVADAGTVSISGLPYAVDSGDDGSGGNVFHTAAYIGYTTRFTARPFASLVRGDSDCLALYYAVNDGTYQNTSAPIQDTNLSSSSDIIMSGSYKAA